MADLICQSCQGAYYETTDAFRIGETPTGDMFKPKPIVNQRKWFSWLCLKSTALGDMECPQCGSLYYHNGVVKVEGDTENNNKSIPDSKNELILELTEQGMTPTQIAEQIGTSRQAVGRRLYDLGRKK